MNHASTSPRDSDQVAPAGPDRWPEPIVNIVGEKIALGPLDREHIPLHVRWLNDFHVLRTFGEAPRPRVIESLTKGFEHHENTSDALRFTVYDQATWQPVGRTGLFEIDPAHGTAVFGVLLGEAAGRGKGFGTETARLMLDHGFTALGLHSIRLDVDEFNLAGRRAYEKAGFREFGRRRQATWMGGHFYDLIYMECLANEFPSRLLRVEGRENDEATHDSRLTTLDSL